MRSETSLSFSIPLVIAVDGPAASGKGTLARRIADHFEIAYLDTGSLYRAVAYILVQRQIPLDDIESAAKAAREINTTDLDSRKLRTEDVGQAASTVSQIPQVRAALLDFQRNFARSGHGAVLDGRDIGTVICPDATVKLFITADNATRAKRRYEELCQAGIPASYESLLEELQIRDARDRARPIAPLIAAPDAVTIDTSNMTADEVFEKAVAIIMRGIK